MSPEVAQRKGSALINLKCSEISTALMGKALLTLEPNRGAVLPAHKFSPHDVVEIKPNKVTLRKEAARHFFVCSNANSKTGFVYFPNTPQGENSTIASGVVYRVQDSKIIIAVDDLPEDGLGSALKIYKVVENILVNAISSDDQFEDLMG